MKKVNLLSKAEMKKVMGGNPPIGGGDCDHECPTDGAKCGANDAGKCETYDFRQDCGEYIRKCIIP